MASNFNVHKYKKIFEQRYGAGSFDAGLSSARDIGRLKAEASIARDNYTSIMKKAQAEAEKQAEVAMEIYGETEGVTPEEKESVVGNNPGSMAYAKKQLQLIDPEASNAIDVEVANKKRKDAEKDVSESTKEKRAKEKERETKNPFVDSDTQHYYNQKKQLDDFYKKHSKYTENRDKKDRKDGESFLNKNPRLAEEYTKMGGHKTFPTQKDYDEQKRIFEATNKKDSKPKKSSKKDEPGFFDDVKTAAKGAAEFFNPFDDVSASEAVGKVLKHTPAKSTQEISRGMNRFVDSTTLGAMSNLDKKLNDRTPSYTETRKVGEGGVTDMATSGLGYLLPGLGAVKGARALGLGAKEAQGLGKLGQIAKEGAVVGGAMGAGEVGIREALNPEDSNWKENAATIGLGVAGGAILDPALHGVGGLVGKGLSKYAKGDVPTYTGQAGLDTLNKMNKNTQSNSVKSSTELFDRLQSMNKQKVPEYTNSSVEKSIPIQSEPRLTAIDDIVKSNGFDQITPDSIAKSFNNKTWYHGTGTKGLSADSLDPFVGNHESLFGQGIYLTDDANIAQGYAKSRSKRTNTPAMYEANINMDRVLDIEQPVSTPEVQEALTKFAKPLDSEFHRETGKDGHFTSRIQEMTQNGNTVEDIIQTVRKEISEFSNELGIPTSEFAETFQDLAIYLREAGYDGITHTGGKRTGNDPHRVLIALDPNDMYSNTGRKGQISRFEEYVNSNAENSPVVRESASAVERITPEKYVPMKRVSNEVVTPSKPVNIKNPKELVKKQIDSKGQKIKNKISFDKIMTAVVDDLRPLEKATKQLGGKNLNTDKNPYIQARLSRGVAGKAETFLKGGIYTEDGQKIGKSLQEIIKPVEGKIDDLMAYITSKRALDYDEKGLTAGIKPKDVEGITDRQLAEATMRQIEAESPELKTAQKELVKYSHSLMEKLKESGYYTDDALKRIFEENPNYVPMNRVQEPKVRGFQPLTSPSKKFASLSDPIKKRTGSTKPIINPIESLVKNTYVINNVAERNKVATSLLDLLEKAPEDNMWGRVVQVGKQDDSSDGLTSLLDEAAEQFDREGNTEVIDKLFKGEGNKVYAYRKGEKVEMELQEDLYKSILSLDSEKQNIFIKILSVPTRTLRAGATLSPDFGPVNIFRDQFSAYINSKYGFKPFVDMFSGLGNVLKKDDIYWSWKNNGGANSVLSSLDREYLQKDIRTMVKQSMSGRVKHAAKHPLDTALEPLRKASELTEEATRLGEFKKGLKRGATPKEAAFASRDLIDFSRAGSKGRQFNQITAFFNAAVQSMDKMARTFKENPVGATTRSLMSITLPSIVAYVYNHDEDWYKELPQRDRDLYWHFKVGDQIVKLPKPFEAGILFGTSVERTLRALNEQDPEAFKGFGKSITDAFTPNWIPTAVQPWIEVYGNKSIMFDSPIVPRREEDLLPEDQYGPYQSEIAKGLGKISKTSPRKIEQVFKGYTGGLGKYALGISDKVAEVAGKEKAELPDRGLADKPIVNRFVVKNLEGNNQSVNDFYERMDKLRREVKSAEKNNKTSKSEGSLKEINKLNKDISELQKEKRLIIEDKTMNGKEKADAIKEVDRLITKLAKEGNSLR